MANAGNSERAKSKQSKPGSEVEFLGWISDKCQVHWQLSDGTSVIGSINWFDKWNINITSEELGELTIPKHAMVWYRKA